MKVCDKETNVVNVSLDGMLLEVSRSSRGAEQLNNKAKTLLS